MKTSFRWGGAQALAQRFSALIIQASFSSSSMTWCSKSAVDGSSASTLS